MIFASICLSIIACVPAQTADRPSSSSAKSYDVGPIRAQVDCARNVFALSEAIEATVTISAPADVQIRPIEVSPTNGTCKLLSAHLAGEDQVERWVLRNWKLRFEPMKIGETKLGTATIEYKTRTIDWTKADVPLPAITIVPGPNASSDVATLKPIPKPASRNPAIAKVFPWVGIGGFAALAIYLLLANRSTKPNLSPREQALLDLSKQEQQSNDPQFSRAIIQEVCAIVRRYLASRVGATLLQQTTEEILHDPKIHDKLQAFERSVLEEFLPWADYERFSTAKPDESDCQKCIEQARKLFECDLVPA